MDQRPGQWLEAAAAVFCVGLGEIQAAARGIQLRDGQLTQLVGAQAGAERELVAAQPLFCKAHVALGRRLLDGVQQRAGFIELQRAVMAARRGVELGKAGQRIDAQQVALAQPLAEGFEAVGIIVFGFAAGGFSHGASVALFLSQRLEQVAQDFLDGRLEAAGGEVAECFEFQGAVPEFQEIRAALGVLVVPGMAMQAALGAAPVEVLGDGLLDGALALALPRAGRIAVAEGDLAVIVLELARDREGVLAVARAREPDAAAVGVFVAGLKFAAPQRLVAYGGHVPLPQITAPTQLTTIL